MTSKKKAKNQKAKVLHAARETESLMKAREALSEIVEIAASHAEQGRQMSGWEALEAWRKGKNLYGETK